MFIPGAFAFVKADKIAHSRPVPFIVYKFTLMQNKINVQNEKLTWLKGPKPQV